MNVRFLRNMLLSQCASDDRKPSPVSCEEQFPQTSLALHLFVDTLGAIKGEAVKTDTVKPAPAGVRGREWMRMVIE